MIRRHSFSTPRLMIPLVAALLLGAIVACGESDHINSDGTSTAAPPSTADPPPAETPTAEPIPAKTPSPLDQLGLLEPWTGDLDGMVERRAIRALVVHNQTHYFLDGAEQRGLTYEALREFERFLSHRLATGHLRVHLVFVPVSRDEIFEALVDGRGDLAAAHLTITPDRLARVDFSIPAAAVDEIVVSGPSGPNELTSLNDLAGREIWVRRSSSYFTHLQALDARLRAEGKAGIAIRAADEFLETEDLLEMVHAGIVQLTVADTFLAGFWSQIFDGLKLHPQLAVARDTKLAWAWRKDSPGLAEVANAFLEENKKGTLFGNILLKRYLRSTRWVEGDPARAHRRRFEETASLFRQYAGEYGFDWLMVIAQGYQESRLDQSLRSPVGAIGVMQLLPSTAADPAVGIPAIEELDKNIHAGVKYLRHLHDTYFDDAELDPLNRHLFAFAAYNAGPNRVRRLRRQASEAGLDPNVWFDHVEVMAAREIGRETVQYVSNIAKYYVAYRLLEDRAASSRELESSSPWNGQRLEVSRRSRHETRNSRDGAGEGTRTPKSCDGGF